MIRVVLALSVASAAAWSLGDLAVLKHRQPQRTAALAPQMVGTTNQMTIATPKLPTGVSARWQVHKFGGASLATGELYIQCSDLLRAESAKGAVNGGSHIPTMAIVSAKGGVTDKLIKVVNAAKTDIEEAKVLLNAVAMEQIEVTRQVTLRLEPAPLPLPRARLHHPCQESLPLRISPDPRLEPGHGRSPTPSTRRRSRR